MTQGVRISDGRSSIFLHPPVPFPSESGYRQLVDLSAGPFRGTIEAESYGSNWFCLFRDELAALHRSLKGKANLHGYDNLTLSLAGDGMGHDRVKVDADGGDPMEFRLSFEFSIDQTQLPEVIAGIEGFL